MPINRPLTIFLAPLLALLLLTACTAADLQIHTPTPDTAALPTADYSLSGTVTRGQTYSQNVATDLAVQLIPTTYGWELWVGDPTVSTATADNFAMPATPPFYGINARQIDGWHFRNSDNSGPNDAGDKNVNAPQALRAFCFVSTNEDFQRALEALATGIPALGEAIAADAFPLHRGTLTITDYTLGNLVADEQAWFEEIEFAVTLDLDQPCDLF